MSLSAEEVEGREFHRTEGGYAEDEVRDFLAEVAKSFRALQASIRRQHFDALTYAVQESEESVAEAISIMLADWPRLSKIQDELLVLLRTALVRDRVEEEIAGEPGRILTDEVMSADELLVEARIAGDVHRRILGEEVLDAAAVSHLLGSRSTNPRQYANALRKRGSIIGIPHRNKYLYPAFQFDFRARRVDPIVQAVNTVLGADDDPWGVASWWLSPNDRLSGGAPKDALADPETRGRLPSIAKAMTEPLG